jgi:amidase
MASDELCYWPLSRVAEAIRARRVSALDATTAVLDRIARLEPRLHAFVTVTAEQARARATALDAELAAGRAHGPLHGVPIGVKDLCATRGVPTTGGGRVHRDWRPDFDAVVVERLESAGAVVVGKLKTTEGAFAAHHPDVTPPVNPWDASVWTGISSSGSGVATAAGLCFGSLGTDTGGSIRYPAACNGLVGLKPTWGRVPRHGVFDLAESLDHVGPLTRTVRDAAVMLGVLAGPDPRDPTALHAPVDDYVASCDGSLRGVRIGVDEAWCQADSDPGITAAVLAAGHVLRDAGAEIVAVTVPFDGHEVGPWVTLCAAEVAHAHRDQFPARAADYGPALRDFLEHGLRLMAVDYARAHAARLALRGQLAAVFADVDLLLCPALGVVLPANVDLAAPVDHDAASAGRFTIPFDLSGSPTITLPCGVVRDGLPVGLQLVARDLDEALLCRAAAAYERATPWHERHPVL